MGKQFSKKKPSEQKEIVSKIINDVEFVNDMINLSGFYQLENNIKHFLSNNYDKKIRAENVSHKLSHMRSLYEIISPLLNDTEFYENNFSSNYPNLVTEIQEIQKLIVILENIDSEMYIKYTGIHQKSILNIFNQLVKTHNQKTFENVNKVIHIYQKIQKDIFEPYMIQYYVNGIHPVISQYVLNTMKHLCNNVIDLNKIIKIFEILKNIQEFNEFNIQVMIKQILSNSRKDNAILCDFNESDLVSMVKLCTTFEELNISQLNEFIRFVMINMIRSDIDKNNYVRKLMYTKYGEICISQFVLSKMDVNNVPFEMLLSGLTTKDMMDNHFIFDIYYLYYQHRKNPENVYVRNDTFIQKFSTILSKEDEKEEELFHDALSA
jgi:hypothetical protein